MRNKKGFTLVELLAVVTILAILVLLAIPNVTRYVEQSRKKTFVEDAKTIVSTAKSNYASGSYELTNGIDSSKKNKVIYSKVAIDSILSSKFGKSSFNSDYKDAGVIISKTTDEYGATRYNYYVCLIDKAGNGFDYTSDKDLNTNSLSFDQETTNCTGLPRISYTVNVVVNNGSVNESEKKVYEDEDTSFDLIPNSSGMESTVSCTNNQKGILNHNTLTVKGVTASTTCTVTFSQSMTVLYNDGTLIINEKPSDRNSNISKHGEVAKEYAGMSNSNQYVFGQSSQPWNSEKENITRVIIGEKIQPINTQSWFNGLINMSYGDFTNLDVSNTTNMAAMFRDIGKSSSITSLELKGLNNWNTSKVTNMRLLFADAGYSANSFNLDLSNWDTSKVTDMYAMFASTGYNATAWDVGNLNNWNTSNVEDMQQMFHNAGYRAASFNINLSSWNTSKVTNMYAMFASTGYNASTWSIGDLSNWDTSKVTNMLSMFLGAGYSASSFDIGNIGIWNLSNVENIDSMFSSAGVKSQNFYIGDLSNWKFPKVKSFRSLFFNAASHATTFDIGDLGKWNVSNITNMISMFAQAGEQASTWHIGDLSNWDVSNVTTMYCLFRYTGFNAAVWNIGDLSRWNVSKVTNMGAMFDLAGVNATDFSLGDLSNWDTRNVTSMSSMFAQTGKNSTTWRSIGTFKVYATDTHGMFFQSYNATATLNIYSSINNYEDMFDQCTSRNGRLITVNYSSAVTNIDSIIATKSSNSNVVKGSLIS